MDVVPPRRRFRLVKVWWVVFRVLGSYGVAKLVGFVRGAEWLERTRIERHRRNARRARDTILEVQGLFIKVGQLVSILSNFLPEEFRGELESVQDRIPGRPLEQIRARIRAELGAEPEALFASFDREPLASASLAQVHAATLEDGRRVAVKVQHWDIEETARRDLATIRRLLQLVQLIFRIRGLLGVYDQVRAMVEEELDFAREADSLETIATFFVDDPDVVLPPVVRERSSRRVLTTGFIDGVKVTDLAALAERGHDRAVLAERIVRVYCRMIFRDGLYHADPHPGNLLVLADGRLALLDFGAVARLSPEMKAGIPQLVEGVLKRNRDEIIAALRRMGFVQRRKDDVDVADRAIDYVYSRLLQEIELDSFHLKDIQADVRMKAEMMADLSNLGISFRELTAAFQVPRDWILLERTLLLLTGVCHFLNPELQPLSVIRPYLAELLLGKDRDWLSLAGSVVKDLAVSALTLPGDFKKVLHLAHRGEFEMRTRGLVEGAELVYAAGHQLLWGLLGMGTGGLAYFAHTRGDQVIALACMAGTGFFFLCLVVSLWRARKTERRLRRVR
jgi:predicted unusual protein kinase regulating ubiquinone biosynthesis (AarF/ABC1/UbiB family)